ncbi:MAG: Rpn family recombination-promoting nuclease/putative transposase [Chitinophagales bacterium]|nr:Rpn family recombination-promoting nuclease/putative transposase [Chitinophagales bacterium]
MGRKCGKVTNGSQDSFIDNKLSAHFSDVCYVGQTNAQKPLRIAIVFEHKSAKPDSPLAEQLLRYISNIWNADVRQQRDLSLTIPIVLYHGHEVI